MDMKRILVFATILSLTFNGFSQVEEALDKTQQNQRSSGHKKGQLYVMPALGLGSYYGNSMVLPPLMLNVEYGFHDMLSIGAMGGYGIARTRTTRTISGEYYWRYNYIMLAGRASFHWGRYLNIPDELDLYGRASLGWKIRTVTWVDNGSGVVEPAAGNELGLVAGIHAGAKYMLTPALGAFLEVGHDNVSSVQLGLAFKL
jgi:hypothetical protein